MLEPEGAPLLPVQFPELRPIWILSISKMGDVASTPSQLKTNEKVLAEDSIWNSLPVMVHAVAAEREPIVANVPSSFDTVNEQPSGVTPEDGTLYANEYQYDPFVAGVSNVCDNVAVTSSNVGWNRANPLPSYAVSEDAISRLCLDGAADEFTPPQTISTSSNVQPVLLHSKLGLLSI